MSTSTGQGTLFGAESVGDMVVINGRCVLRAMGAHRAVMAAGLRLAHFAVGDGMAEAHAMVSLIEQGWASQLEVARAFGCTARTVRRHQRRFEEGGLAALGRKSGYPQGRSRLPVTRTQWVNRLKADGLSNRVIGERIGVSEKAVRKLLRRLGWVERRPEQQALPLGEAADPKVSALAASPEEPRPATAAPGADPKVSASAASPEEPRPATAAPGADPKVSASTAAPEEPLPATAAPGAAPKVSASAAPPAEPISLDPDPANRAFDRLFAQLGLLDDAAPLFRGGTRVPRAGVLLALPALVASGVFDCAQDVYGSIGPAFYGLRTSILALLLMALMRIKRPEALKEHCPADLGRILGLDRAPEVKTLRRKLTRLAATGGATELGRALAKKRAAAHASALGFLYVDGHVRVYHGKHTLPKTHSARTNQAVSATSDYWIGDERGDPLLVVTADANAGLVKMLPVLLGEVRSVVGTRRVTIVFDRGGYSPKLFKKLIADGFDVLTYRKGRWRRVPRGRFQECRATFDGREVSYTLADQNVRLGKLTLRQVTRLSANGHQTPVLTSRRDLPAAEVAARMFARWQQENFFKYLREEYALDALIDHAVVPDDPFREVPNPRWIKLDKELRDLRKELEEVHAVYGLEADFNQEAARRTMRGFKIANATIGAAIHTLMGRIRALCARRDKTPKRVPVQDTVAAEVVKLAPEKKHLSNILKMVAYQAESDLVRLVEPHYKRADDEGRTLVQTMLASSADFEIRGEELHVRLVPLSSAHRTKALTAICEQLNSTRTRFPGSNLTLCFGVQEA
jgi:transposase